jgi:MFS_1 like family
VSTVVDREGRRLRVLYAAVGGGIGTLLPYLVLYLTDRGLSPTGAGLVIGLMSAVGVLVIPLWARLAEVRRASSEHCSCRASWPPWPRWRSWPSAGPLP